MDRIDLLEAKVKQMIDLVQSLRDENHALAQRLADAEARVQAVGEERTVLDRERDQVRTRIEQLLGELEGVAAPDAEGAGDNGDGRPDEAGADGPPGEGRRVRRSQNPVLPGLG